VGKRAIIIMIAVIAGALIINSTVMAQTEKPKIAPLCKQCHTPEDNVLRGNFVFFFPNVMQVNVGPAKWLLKLDRNTQLKGATGFDKIPVERGIAVSFTERDGDLYAISVSVKSPPSVPEVKLVRVDEMARLVALGPEKGNFVLVDTRPTSRYLEGHIPGAISIPDTEFERHVENLPKDLNKLIIFYSLGPT
jgi:hypothetical protein